VYRVAHPIGRLVTLRLASPIDEAECERAVAEIARTLMGVSGKARICSDLTGARTFPPEVAERFVRLMKADNVKIERSGFLVSDAAGATFGLQMERMIREAANPSRRTFREVGALKAWIAELLDPAERDALGAFLGEVQATG
jgi:hypothetical protein